mmetsp:Transcript_94407/g.305419  ORF Transcript_94407/g.305419 Transcript_94407/m.305419 type:complete len:709 (-) Transcript_94407:70-2196(-)
MKFGKQLECLNVPRYRLHYIQYKELKKALKVWTGLEKEQSTVQEVTHWASSFLRLGPNPEVSPEMRLNEMLRHEMERISRFTGLEESGLHTELNRLEEECKGADVDGVALAKRLDDLGEQIVQLKTFAQLNFSGFRKILKKYDKWSDSKAAVTPWFMAEVVRAPFMRVNFELLLEQLNRIAVALRSKPGATLQRARSGVSLQTALWTAREVSFMVDPKDTMQVRVMLARHLLHRGQYMTSQAAAAVGRTRTTCVFLDTEDLTVYGASREGAVSVPSSHLRHADGDAVMLVHEGTEVLLTRSEAVKLLEGSAVMPVAPGALPIDAIKAVEGLCPPAAEPAAQAALLAAQRSVQQGGQKPIAQASYVRSVFQDRLGGFTVVLDEEVRMARTVDPFAKHPAGTEYVPQSIITISSAPSAQSSDVMQWYQVVQERTNLVQVVGFSMATLVVAHFFAKERGLPEPHWYRSLMNNTEENEPGSGEISDQHSVSGEGTATPTPKTTKATAATEKMPPWASPSGRRLLHEFNTSPEEEAAAATGSLGNTDEGSVPAADGGGLDAPLLARERDTPAAPARESGLKLVLRAFGLVTPVDTEAKPVRKAIVAVQPKTLYSNERTFLEWMHFATLLATSGVVMMHGFANAGTVALGRFVVLVAIFLACWSLHTFNWRADALDQKEIIDYQDPVGPGAVIFAMLVALVGTTLHALYTGGGD